MTVTCIFCGKPLFVPHKGAYEGMRPDLKNIPDGVGYAQSRISRHYNFFHNSCFKEVINNVRKSD